MKVSKFGEKFCKNSGILELMDDLGRALAGDEKKYMLGGGNPPHIPDVQKVFRQRMKQILDNENEFERMIGNYDTPQGNQEFIKIFTDFINDVYGWDIGIENVAITSGSQSGFYMLFNILAGEFSDGSKKKILLPLTPEYIGYADQGLSDDLFVSVKPEIKHFDKHTYKYYVDFSQIKITSDIAAICCSRPTNPTGNVLTDEEIDHLILLAQQNNIPFIIDNAYGEPFPNIIFKNANLKWDKNIIHSFSLSKVGLPSARTGIIVASKEIIKIITNANAILSLANSSYGQYLMKDLIQTKEILNISKNIIKPYYETKSEFAKQLLHKYFGDDLPWHVHISEGCLFLWVWFENIPITTKELYSRLKLRNVVIVPGEYFFPGLAEEWKHKSECIRINYSMNMEDVEKGIQIISEEVKKAYLLT
ncbi:valine--pyruvate transaminase [Candidatus Dojkabacteria bacterium]|nr:valine--pyruvate transaminase [Candidatus Dojkabacteria bacterium]